MSAELQPPTGERYYRYCLAQRLALLTSRHYNLDNLAHLGQPYTVADGTIILLPNAYVRDPAGWERDHRGRVVDTPPTV